MSNMKLLSHNLKNLSDGITLKHKNFIVDVVNDGCLRMAVNEENVYGWHSHPNSDELFVVLEGELVVEFKEHSSLTLRPGDTLTVPKGLIHRTITKTRTVNLCFESMNSETVFL